MKRITVLVFLIIISAASWSCKKESSTVKIGVLPVIDTLPLVVADSEGLFRAAGINVELVYFNSALERDSAFASGALQGSFGDIIAALLSIKSGIDTRIVCESFHTDRSGRIFGLLGSPSSKARSIADIGTDQVAISTGTIIEFFLDEIVRSKNSDPGRIKKIEVKAIPVRYQMLMSGSVKYALIPEPLAGMAIKEGAILLADDTALDTTATVIFFRNSYLEKNPDKMKAFITAYNEAVKSINSSPEKYRPLVLEKMRIPEKIKDSYTVPRFNQFRLPAEKDILRVYDWMKSLRMIDMPFGYDRFTWKPETK